MKNKKNRVENEKKDNRKVRWKMNRRIKKKKENGGGLKEKNRMENEKKDVKGSVCEKRWGV